MASGDSLLVFDPLSNRPPAVAYASVDLRNGFVVLDFDDTSDEKALFFSTVSRLTMKMDTSKPARVSALSRSA